MIKIIKFERDKASLFPYLYTQPSLTMQQCMEEDNQIATMKQLTCDNRVDEVCRTIERSAKCFEDYIDNLQRVNEMLLKGITLSQIISVLQGNKYESIDWRNNYMLTNYDCYADLLKGTIKVQIDKDRRGFGYNPEITDINIIVPNKVIEVFFNDGTKEKMVCHKDDTFNLRNGLFIAIAKHLYKQEYTQEGIEWKAFELTHLKKYVKIVDAALKNYDRKLKDIEKSQMMAKAEEECIERKRIKKLEHAKRRAAKREEIDKEKQIEIQKEAYIRAMKSMKEEK